MFISQYLPNSHSGEHGTYTPLVKEVGAIKVLLMSDMPFISKKSMSLMFGGIHNPNSLWLGLVSLQF